MKQHLFFVLGIHLICSTIATQLVVRQRRQGEHAHQHVKIQNLDVQCSNAGLSVSVDFDGPFDGVVYSKGFFGSQKCRYVQGSSGSRRYSFVILADDCGTENVDGSRSNVVIFQMDETIQEVWDVARKLSCDVSPNGVRKQAKKHGKTVIFKPLSVGMLDIQHQPFKSDGLDCWMDIQLGHFPNTVPIGGQVKIGEELSVIIYLKDDKRMYDVGVKDCWAFNNDDFDHPATAKVQLTDADGCVKKSKLIGNWRKTYEPGDSGATTIAYTNMTAFKFPDSDNVHLTCNIEVCEDYCEETCASNSGAVLPTSTSRPPSQPGTTSPSVTTTRPPICYPNNFDSRCPKETQVATFPASEESEAEVLPGGHSTRRPLDETEEDIQPGGYTTRRPYTYPTTTTYTPVLPDDDVRSTTKKPLCYPGQIDPRCEPMCYPGSTDKRCKVDEDEEDIQPGGYTTQRPFTYPTTTYRTTYPTTARTYPTTTRAPLCYPGQIDPRCPPVCTPGSTDRRCKINEDEEDIQPGGYTTRRPFTYPTTTYRTTQPPRTFPTTVPTTTRPFQCYPGSLDFRCLRPTTALTTYPTMTTKKPVRCYPGQIDPRCPPVCSPGSTDKRCKVDEDEEDIQPGGYTTRRPFTTYPKTTYRTTQRPTTTQAPRTYPTTTRTTSYVCYPGSLDYRCLPQTTTRTPLPDTEIRKPLCYPGQIDPRCPPVCTPGSTDKRCLEEEDDIQPGGYTTKVPTTYRTTPRPVITTQPPRTFPTTQRTTPFQCYPGSLDPRCLRQTTTLRPYTTSTTKKPLCYPGQIDPRCPPVCTPGSTDRRCKVDEDEEDIQPGGYTTPRPFTYPTTTTYRTTPRPVTTYSTTTTKTPLCYPGQIDPRCPPVCTPGSTDKRCKSKVDEDEEDIQPGGYTTRRPTTYRTTTYRTTPRPVTTTYPTTPRTFATTTRAPLPDNEIRKPLCYPGQIDPRCPPVCAAGSTDKRCKVDEDEEDIQPGGYTTTRPTTGRPVTTYRPAQTTPFQCYPGSLDFRCLRSTTILTTYSTTTKRPVLCYPGQIDPRCPPVCSPGSTDKRCKVDEDEEDIQPGGHTTRQPTTYQTTTTDKPSGYKYSVPQNPLTYPQDDDSDLKPSASIDRQVKAPRLPFARGPICYKGSFDPRCPKSFQLPAYRDYDDDDHEKYLRFESKKISAEYF